MPVMSLMLRVLPSWQLRQVRWAMIARLLQAVEGPLEEPPLGLNRSLRLGRSQDDWVGVNAARLFQVVHRNASRFEAFPEQTDVGQKYLIRTHAEMNRREPPQICLDR